VTTQLLCTHTHTHARRLYIRTTDTIPRPPQISRRSFVGGGGVYRDLGVASLVIIVRFSSLSGPLHTHTVYPARALQLLLLLRVRVYRRTVTKVRRISYASRITFTKMTYTYGSRSRRPRQRTTGTIFPGFSVVVVVVAAYLFRFLFVKLSAGRNKTHRRGRPKLSALTNYRRRARYVFQTCPKFYPPVSLDGFTVIFVRIYITIVPYPYGGLTSVL